MVSNSSDMTKHKKSLVPTPTKGKGGGKPGKVSGKGESVDLKDLPLELKEIEAPECPRYTGILKRGDTEVSLDELDGLQQELEAALSAVVVRKRELRQESDVVQNIEKYRGRKQKGTASPCGWNKRGSKDSGQVHPAKKIKLAGGKPADTGKVKPSKADYDPLENEQIKPLSGTTPTTPKNEIPNRFWAFVEPYCAPLTQEDVKFVEEMIKGYSDMGEYYRTPPLGQHYAIRWAKEDLDLEKAKGGDENRDVKEESGSKIAKKEQKADSSPFGELTQRLVQGLMEENLMSQVDDVMVERAREDEVGTRNSFIQSLKVSNGDSLERRLRKELEEQGILDPNEDDGDAGHDEVQQELARCQQELRAVSQHNLTQLRRLAKSAREEMARQEVRNRLAEADREVCEAYKKIAASRSKKKSPSKKEKEVAWKAIKDREAILKQLEGI